MLFKAGDHDPEIELFDVLGKGNSVLPEQMAGTCVKLGVVFGFTVMVMDAVEAHCPAAGVNV